VFRREQRIPIIPSPAAEGMIGMPVYLAGDLPSVAGVTRKM
jgi:hypothetical protein